MKKKRAYHNSIYWNRAVYIIGGTLRDYYFDYESFYESDYVGGNDMKTKIEIWNIKDSPNHFKTTENWPVLFDWSRPHLFIVPDSFFPDN